MIKNLRFGQLWHFVDLGDIFVVGNQGLVPFFELVLEKLIDLEWPLKWVRFEVDQGLLESCDHFPQMLELRNRDDPRWIDISVDKGLGLG